MSASRLPSASLLENARLNSLVFVPNAVQGIFRRRRRAVAAATRAGVDRWALGLLEGMRRGHGGSPVWISVVREPALLLFETADVRRALEGSPDPFASDPEPKRKGMSCFQPDALTISRGELWRERRRFNEAVLDTGEPLHRLADRFCAVCRDETARLLDGPAVASDGTLDWDAWQPAVQRVTRRIVLGDDAAGDEAITALLAELMDEANGMPDKPSGRYAELKSRIGSYVSAGQEGSLVGLFADAPAGPGTAPAGQVPHWMFALGDTLAANALRALALIGSHPRQRVTVLRELARSGAGGPRDAASVAGLGYLDACLEEAMRLWPTTPLLSRVTVGETELGGESVPAGTQVMFSNLLGHRDRTRHEFADRFAPERWTEHGAAGDWSFNHFSHGPQGCPGTGIAKLVGKAMLAELLATREVRLASPTLDPDRPLPQMLDYFALRVQLAPRANAS